MFGMLESVAFDTGYAGSAGLVPQSWVNGNGTSYIYYGAGEFDGQGSGDDFWGTVRSYAFHAVSDYCIGSLCVRDTCVATRWIDFVNGWIMKFSFCFWALDHYHA